MKKLNIIKLSVILLVLVFSCKEPDNAIYSVLDNTTNGAALRQIDQSMNPPLSKNFNIFDLESTWEIIIEEQDEQYGELLSKVNVYVGFIDNANEGANNKTEVLLKTIEASEFDTSGNGLPSTHITLTFQDALAALGLAVGDYSGGDSFPIRLELLLTDGRTFSSESTSGSLQQSYWSSPFSYLSKILCIPEKPIAGDYVMNMQDAYGDGWNGASVRVTIDGVATDYFIPDGSSGSATITVPEGANSLTWEFISGSWDSEVTFQIYGPNSGNVIGDFGPTPAEGLLSLNYCDE